MRILMVDPLPSTLPYDRKLCSALADLGHEVRFVSQAWNGSPRDIAAGVEHRRVQISNIFAPNQLRGLAQRINTAKSYARYACEIQSIRREVLAFQPDVVHFQWCLAPLADRMLVWRISRNTATVHTVHDLTPFNGEPVSAYSIIGLDWLLRSFNRLIVHSEGAKAAITAKGLAAFRTIVVPHGPLQSYALTDARNDKYLLSNRKILITLFGILRNYKGIDILIRAASELAPEVRSKCQIQVIGRPDMDLTSLDNMRQSLGVADCVEIIPRFVPEDEVESILRKSDIFVFPYRQIEASGVFSLIPQFGVPVVATNIGVFKDYIRDYKNGILIERESSNALASALTYLICHPLERVRMGAEMARMYAKMPAWDKIAQLTLAVYDEAKSDIN